VAWRKFVFNVNGLKNRRQDLRSKSTLAEKVLWRNLRDKQLDFRFFRQYSVEGYVMDFYCPEKRVGIELEGQIHDLKQVDVYDRYRERHLETYNIKLLKFKNAEVLADIKKVLKQIAISLS
jgi:very-short-patch-repair endonuclease